MDMEQSVTSSDHADNIVTQNYLEELLDQVITLKANVAGKECEKNKTSAELDSLTSKIQQTVVTAAELKSKHVLSPKQPNVDPCQEISKEPTNFKEQFNQLQQILGITIDCSPEKKLFEITFNDAQKSRVSFTYNAKGIEIEEMHPTHPNFEAIRDNLRETGDLLGFLTIFSRRLMNA
ncbi:uncharacterized protein LOC131261515 [Anopheles coustani]|uniref:uncharacterized protein LOC131261515 n=1 Tax=Anopheles coustani TaxID=139045 RepID=UPI00265943A7|nr:uncharacterized protein LOC131261515 [Anopheles coustani]